MRRDVDPHTVEYWIFVAVCVVFVLGLLGWGAVLLLRTATA